MTISDHVKPGLGEVKQPVRIITVDPSTRRVEAALKDGAMIQIRVYDVGAAFRWPATGEIWTVRRDNGMWELQGRLEANEDGLGRIEEIPEGATKITGDTTIVGDLTVQGAITRGSTKGEKGDKGDPGGPGVGGSTVRRETHTWALIGVPDLGVKPGFFVSLPEGATSTMVGMMFKLASPYGSMTIAVLRNGVEMTDFGHWGAGGGMSHVYGEEVLAHEDSIELNILYVFPGYSYDLTVTIELDVTDSPPEAE